jgi:RNA polymerase sigma-70 factor (ECF subfamily)
VREHEAALDLAQDVLLRAYQRLDSFQGQARFSTWLFVVARNVCLAARRRFQPQWADEADLSELASREPDPEEEFFRREDEERLLELMRTHLDEVERRALWMRSVERIAVETITEELGLQNATGARALLQRARRKLRAALREEGGER